ncbi:MAG: hypothetical protein KKH98_15390 [Spirochaetes bacterium]|nr:hypothetical protein [Spirochaetota bacterium]
MRGTYTYDLQKITGFRRNRTVQLQIGITSGTAKPNKDLYVKIKSMILTKASVKTKVKIDKNFSTYFPEIKKNLRGWDDKYPDGAPTGATIDFTGDQGIVKGTAEKMNYGFVYREVDLDLDKYPVLEISIDKVSEGWYLVIHSKDLPSGYVKLERYNTEKGVYEFDLKKKLKMNGVRRFWVSLGVVVERNNIRKNIGQYVRFNYIKFKSRKSLKEEQEDIKKKRKLLKEIDINSISLKNKFFIPERLNKKKIGIQYEKGTVNKNELESEEEFKFLNDAKSIFRELAYDKGEIKSEPANFLFLDDKYKLSLKNENYEIIFEKNNGSLKSIVNVRNKRKIILDNNSESLWKMDFKDGTSLLSKDFDFSYVHTPDESLVFNYKKVIDQNTKAYSEVKITLIPSQGYFIDFIINIKNNLKKDIINFSFPDSLLFQYRHLDKFLFPFKMGLALNKKFYQQKRQLMDKYPNLFADLSSIQLQYGQLSIYSIQKQSEMFQPVNLETGYHHHMGGAGYYTHKYISYIKSGEEFDLPVIRMNFDQDIKRVMEDYRKVNGINEVPSLEKKLGSSLYKKLKRSVLMKIEVNKNRDFQYIKSFIRYLSAPTIVHLVSFWLGGFDRNYPDYLPPDEAFGTTSDMRSLCKAISDSGNIVMPYTNPTWWQAESKTLEKLGVKNITLKNFKGDLISESYNKSTGYLVNPFHPDVISRINQTVQEFTDDVPVDILFEDQLGARKWFYGSNKELPSANAYVQGILNIAKRNHEKIPLFTEEGFDRLMFYESGFCNMSAANNLPPDDNFNVRFGKGTWSIMPLALYLGHDKVAFYQHNLAHEVFSDSIKKITWNLLYGHNLYIGRWVSSWAQQVKDYKVADAIQKEIIALYFDKKLIDHQMIDEGVFYSQFEDTMIVGNLSEEEYKVGRYSIAKDGFMAVNKEGTLMAGVFTKFNGEYLGGERIIIMKKKDDALLFKQLSAENSFITLPRPKSWKFDSNIDVYYGDEKIPFVSGRKGITLYMKYDQDEKWYKVSYNAKKQSGYDIRIASWRRDRDVSINIELLSFQKMEKIKLGINPYLVRPLGSVPGFSTGENDFYSKIIKTVDENEKVTFTFSVPIPENANKDDSIWVNLNLYEGSKQIKQASGIAKLSESLDLIPDKKKISFYPGEKKTVRMFLYNYSSDQVKGKIICNYPKEFKGKKVIPFDLGKNSKKEIKIILSSDNRIMNAVYNANFDVIVNQKKHVSTHLKLTGEPVTYYLDIDPVNTLLVNEKNKLVLSIHDLPGDFKKSRVYITVPKKWSLFDFKSGYEHDFSRNNFMTIPFIVKPGKAGEGVIGVKVQSGIKKIFYKERFKSFSPESASLLTTDMNSDGVKDIIIANSKIEVVVTPVIGARILKIINRKTGNNQLFTDYPGIEITTGSSWESWAEYGGLNDWWPSGWPGDVWNNKWDYKIIRNTKDQIQVDFSSSDKDKKLSIQRSIKLDKNKNYIAFNYQFKNLTEVDVPFFYNSHPDMAPGENNYADESDYAVIPIKKKDKMEVVFKPFIKSLSKQSYTPGENWCIALDNKNHEYIGQIFTSGRVQSIGVWQGINFFSMELISEGLVLKPFEMMQLKCYYFIGQENWEEDLKKIKKEVNLR